MMEILIALVFGGAMLFLIHGAYLMVQDSEKLYKERKRVAKKYPELTRLQVKLIAKLNMEKLDD
ncbi:hypothetical protein OAN77_00055 [bacterium]|nr:hypothetical protein [bacterium]